MLLAIATSLALFPKPATADSKDRKELEKTLQIGELQHQGDGHYVLRLMLDDGDKAGATWKHSVKKVRVFDYDGASDNCDSTHEKLYRNHKCRHAGSYHRMVYRVYGSSFPHEPNCKTCRQRLQIRDSEIESWKSIWGVGDGGPEPEVPLTTDPDVAGVKLRGSSLRITPEQHGITVVTFFTQSKSPGGAIGGLGSGSDAVSVPSPYVKQTIEVLVHDAKGNPPKRRSADEGVAPGEARIEPGSKDFELISKMIAGGVENGELLMLIQLTDRERSEDKFFTSVKGDGRWFIAFVRVNKDGKYTYRSVRLRESANGSGVFAMK